MRLLCVSLVWCGWSDLFLINVRGNEDLSNQRSSSWSDLIIGLRSLRVYFTLCKPFCCQKRFFLFIPLDTFLCLFQDFRYFNSLLDKTVIGCTFKYLIFVKSARLLKIAKITDCDTISALLIFNC